MFAAQSPDESPDGDRVVDFDDRLRDAWRRLDEVFPLALVPLLSSLASVSNVVQVATFEGFHAGITLQFPSAVADLWTFVSLPTPGGGIATGSLLALPLVVLLRAVLAAGYLGSLQECRATGGYAFGTNVGDFFAPMLGYVVLSTLLAFLVAGIALVGDGAGFLLVAVVGVPLFMVGSYLFYGTPYLIVIRDAGLIEALRGSYDRAVAGGAYFSFGIRYLGAVALVSIVATAVVVNLGIVGVLLGSIVVAPVGVVFNLATLEFLADVESD